jgi:hypothetical protein
MKKTLYFDVHVFIRRGEGYSIPVKIETDKNGVLDDEVIQHAIDNKQFSEVGDAQMVDYVDEIDSEQYSAMEGK